MAARFSVPLFGIRRRIDESFADHANQEDSAPLASLLFSQKLCSFSPPLKDEQRHPPPLPLQTGLGNPGDYPEVHRRAEKGGFCFCFPFSFRCPWAGFKPRSLGGQGHLPAPAWGRRLEPLNPTKGGESSVYRDYRPGYKGRLVIH